MFESWFGEKPIPYLPKDRKKLIVLGNTKCHCRLMEKKHLRWKWEKITLFSLWRSRTSPYWNQYQQNGINTNKMESIPTKLVLLSLIKEANVLEQYYIVDNIAKISGCSVLRLPPYRCLLKHIEMVWSQIWSNIFSKKISIITMNHWKCWI